MKDRSLDGVDDRHGRCGRVIGKGVNERIPIGVVGVDHIRRVPDSVGFRTNILVRAATVVHAGIIRPKVASQGIAFVPPNRIGLVEHRLKGIAREIVVEERHVSGKPSNGERLGVVGERVRSDPYIRGGVEPESSLSGSDVIPFNRKIRRSRCGDPFQRTLDNVARDDRVVHPTATEEN